MIEARMWDDFAQQWRYMHFETLEDLEEYEEQTGVNFKAVRQDKGEWKWYK